MKNQALFSLKDKSKKLKCHLLQFLIGALRVKVPKMNIVNFANKVNPNEHLILIYTVLPSNL